MLLALSWLELALRHSLGLLIPLPSDYRAVAVALGPWLACASGISAALVWVLLRLRAPRHVSVMQLAASIALDSAARLLFAEAWLGAAHEAHTPAALLPGLVYVLLVPTALTWGALALFARRPPGGPSPLAAVLAAAVAVAVLAVLSIAPTRAANEARGAADGAQPPPPNLLLVTIDTWRYDHLSAHPSAVAADLTPRLDALAKRGLLFSEARAHASLTVPSHAAMLSGLRPWEMGLLSNSGRVPPGVRWLPEILADEGFATAAVVSGAVLRGRRGFSRGFARFHDDLQPSAGLGSLVASRLLVQLGLRGRRTLFRAPAQRAVTRSKAFVARQQGPWFLWMHLYDPHQPYGEPPRSEEAGAGKAARAGLAALDALADPCDFAQPPRGQFSLAAMLAATSQQREPPSCEARGGLASNVAAYQREVRTADAAVGELLDWLQQRGDLATTAIIVTADHGESITEHGEWMSHQFSPYEPVLRVPLLVVPPGGVPPRHSEALVEHRDLPRTAADLLGLRSALAGRSWLQQLDGDAGQASVASVTQVRPAEAVPGAGPSGPRVRFAVRDRRWSVVTGPGERLESYDLQADPAQMRDLAGNAEHQPAAALVHEAQRLLRQLADEQSPTAAPADPELDALRGLGYRD